MEELLQKANDLVVVLVNVLDDLEERLEQGFKDIQQYKDFLKVLNQ